MVKRILEVETFSLEGNGSNDAKLSLSITMMQTFTEFHADQNDITAMTLHLPKAKTLGNLHF